MKKILSCIFIIMSVISELDMSIFEGNNEYNYMEPLYTLYTIDETETETETDNENDSYGYMDKALNKNIGMIKSLSFDNRTCIICLAENNDETNKEDIVINEVCKSCSYYVHDSCFSNWYEKHNKCIICRENIDTSYYSESTNMDNISPRTVNRLLNIINTRGIDVIGIVGSTGVINDGIISQQTYRCRYLIINIIYITALSGFFYMMIIGMISIDEIQGSI